VLLRQAAGRYTEAGISGGHRLLRHRLLFNFEGWQRHILMSSTTAKERQRKIDYPKWTVDKCS
jgi:hypothetical protein